MGAKSQINKERYMISLKRNTKGEFVEAKGRRVQRKSIYEPYQTEEFRLSRGKFEDFLSCARCFYLDRVRGLTSPGTPGWALNSLTDDLLKKEFDSCREQAIPHRLFEKFDLQNIVPFKHANMDIWRDSLRHGLEFRIEGSGILLTGGIDDLWFNQKSEEVIVLDYKSQASPYPVRTRPYLDGIYHQSYKRQLGVKGRYQINNTLDVGGQYIYNAKLYADYNVTGRGDFGSRNIQPHQLDSYGVLDLRIGARFNLGSLGAYAQVQGYNILDELYWARGIEGSNDLKEGFPSYGRTLNFSVKLNF